MRLGLGLACGKGSLMSVRSSAGWGGLVFCLAAGSLLGASPAGAVAGYGDVSGDRYYTEPVQWSVDNDITGSTGIVFCPDTRCLAAKQRFMSGSWRANPQRRSLIRSPMLTVDAQNAAISWMAETGITTGTSATTFSPQDTLTRGQIATFLHRLAGYPEAPPHSFVDVVKDWQQGPVSWMATTGITTGTSATVFSPEDTLTRAHLVTFLYRYQGNQRNR